jgi:hypothetical protein
MLGAIGGLDSSDGGDQGFLQAFFPDWERLDPKFNVLARRPVDHPELYRPQDAAVVHFVGPKPWELGGALPGRRALDRQWLGFLAAPQLAELVEDLRRTAAGLNGPAVIGRSLTGLAWQAAGAGRFARARRLWRAARLTDAGAAARRRPRWAALPWRLAPDWLVRAAVRLQQKLG